jgi:hypothetical protein
MVNFEGRIPGDKDLAVDQAIVHPDVNNWHGYNSSEGD